MTEPARLPGLYIKEEEQDQPAAMGGALPLSLPPPPTPKFTVKRCHESDGDFDEAATSGNNAKRIKTEHVPEFEPEPETEPELDVDALVEGVLGEMNFGDLSQSTDAGIDPTEQRRPAPTQTSDEAFCRGRSQSRSLEKENERILAHLYSDPLQHARSMSLPLTAAVAVKLALLLLTQSSDGSFDAIYDDSSEAYGVYNSFKQILEASRPLYSSAGLYLSPDVLGMTDVDSVALIRLVNVATLLTALVSHEQACIPEVLESFLDIILPEAAECTPEASELYIAIKCRLVIWNLRKPGPRQPRSEMMTQVMTGGLEDKLRRRHPDADLTEAENQLIANADAKKETLLEMGDDGNADYLACKQDDYHNVQLQALAAYLAQQSGYLLDEAMRCNVVLPTPPCQDESVEGVDDAAEWDFAEFVKRTTKELLVQNELMAEQNGQGPLAPHEIPRPTSELEDLDLKPGEDEYDELAAIVARKTEHYVQTTLSQLSPAPALQYPPHTHTGPQSLYHGQQLYTTSSPGVAGVETRLNNGVDLPPNQSCSTTELYEKARQAALTKNSASTRREGVTSTRRPWTPEEEKALMTGLDIVKGPHWSQILALFGPNGTQSTVLKDRTQVQLKDKARNLKLFFLKTNSEVPYYLQAVTGELKTRAPTQAARKEAEERAREEGQAKYDGIMALDGLRNSPAHAHLLAGHRPPNTPTPIASAASRPAQSQSQYALTPHHLGHPQPITPAPAYQVAMNAAINHYTSQQHPQTQQPLLPSSARPSYPNQAQQATNAQTTQQHQTPAKAPMATMSSSSPPSSSSSTATTTTTITATATATAITATMATTATTPTRPSVPIALPTTAAASTASRHSPLAQSAPQLSSATMSLQSTQPPARPPQPSQLCASRSTVSQQTPSSLTPQQAQENARDAALLQGLKSAV